jgi:peptidoglycan/xylan/chitin deacetylase (PgdA/CDA1 family)
MAAAKQFFFTVDVDWIPGSDAGLRRLYDFCEEEKLASTLFITGRFAEKYPDVIREGVDRGCEVGTHGWDHGQDDGEDFRTGSYEEQKKWMELSTAAVEKACGVRPRAFRAPNLSVSETTLRVLEELDYEYDSSVPAHRFDFFYGAVNHPRYFFAPMQPYKPSRTNIGRRGDSPILEVPPSAFYLPMNMSSLRVLGTKAVRWAVRHIAARTPILVFYVHPVEFEAAENQVIPSSNPERYLKGLGPHNLEPVRELVTFARSLGYESAKLSEVQR